MKVNSITNNHGQANIYVTNVLEIDMIINIHDHVNLHVHRSSDHRQIKVDSGLCLILSNQLDAVVLVGYTTTIAMANFIHFQFNSFIVAVVNMKQTIMW